MNLHTAFYIYNYNKPLFNNYIKSTSSGKYIEQLVENFDTFFYDECIKYNPDMESEKTIINLSQIITNDHIKHIIETEEFPEDLEELLFVYFQEKWIVRLSLQPMRHLIGRSIYTKYRVLLESYQNRFNDGLVTDLDNSDSVGSELFKYVTETMLCMHTYYGNLYNPYINGLVRIRLPHIIGHSYTRTLSEFSYIHNDNLRLQIVNIFKAYYIMFQIKATIIQRYWRQYMKFRRSNSSTNLRKHVHDEQEDCNSIVYKVEASPIKKIKHK